MTIFYKWRVVTLSVLVIAVISAVFLSLHYHKKYKQALEKQQQYAQLIKNKDKTINMMEEKLQWTASIDTKYERKLADAKKRIDKLERDVNAGSGRLRINAVCQPVSANAAPAAGVADAACTRLTDAAQRNYFILRKRIETAQNQIAGLQDYIRHVCLNNKK